MNIFVSLPHVESCCFCISLKIGSVIIAIIHLFFVIEAIFGTGINKDFSNCYTSIFLKILGFIAIAVALFVLGTSFYFLYGIFKGHPNSAVWFMYASALMLIFNIMISVALFMEKTKGNCSSPYVLGAGTLFTSIVLFYFLIVVASFHRVMMYR